MVGPNGCTREINMPIANLPVARLAHQDLAKTGFAVYLAKQVTLVVTMRGTGMIDVFDRRTWTHVAFLDFDLEQAIHLDTAFGKPLIGLPFTRNARRGLGVALEGFATLRQQHHYGLFIDPRYRNRGAQGVWNLDELLVAIALNYAEAAGLAWFRIAPTGDTAPYYRRKFNAQPGADKSGKKTLAISLGADRRPLPHVRIIRSAGHSVALEVPVVSDPSWPPAAF
jgi:hypothetical protein